MGILVETERSIDDIEAASEDALRAGREGTITAAMANLDAVLSEETYTGDVETALVHFSGAEAFSDKETTAPFIHLVEKINDEAERLAGTGEESPFFIPVVVISGGEEELEPGYPTQTTLMAVYPDDLAFTSTRTRRENVSMHGFTDETAGVTDKVLSFVQPTVDFPGNILDVNANVYGQISRGHDLVLAESHIADEGHGQSWSEYAFHNTSLNRFNGAETVLVGWAEIEEAVLGDSTGVDPTQAIRLLEFLNRGVDTAGEDVRISSEAPRLAQLLRTALKIKIALGELAAIQ